MKFILLYLEHSLLLLLPIKIKQPPIVHLPNLNDKQSQYEEEFFSTKISKISSNQIDYQTKESLELMLDELILFFNSFNGPLMQVFPRSLLILDSSIFLFYILFLSRNNPYIISINFNIQLMIILSNLRFQTISQQLDFNTNPNYFTTNLTSFQIHLHTINNIQLTNILNQNKNNMKTKVQSESTLFIFSLLFNITRFGSLPYPLLFSDQFIYPLPYRNTLFPNPILPFLIIFTLRSTSKLRTPQKIQFHFFIFRSLSRSDSF